MGNERLTVLIGGREALPVRAIPYVAGWRRFSPDVVANYLAHNFKLIWFDSITALIAYQLSSGTPVAIRPREWDAVVARLAAFEDELRQKFSSDNIGYAAWRNGAVAKLPAGVFVWLDEFEEKDQAGRESELWCVKKSDHAGEIYDKATYDKLTDEVLDLSPMLLDADTRAMVLEGFKEAVQGALTKTTTIGQGKTASDTSPNGEEIPGKMPRTAIGKLAIDAAWKIERETGKRATGKLVIERLQSWVDHRDNPNAVTELTEKIPNGVMWVTSAGLKKRYDIGTCQKTLENWNKTRT